MDSDSQAFGTSGFMKPLQVRRGGSEGPAGVFRLQA